MSRAKKHNYRGYINQASRAVMIWHNSLECWVVMHFTKKDLISNAKGCMYGFKASKTEAIASMRAQGGKISQKGWSRISFKMSAAQASTWNELSLYAWNNRESLISNSSESSAEVWSSRDVLTSKGQRS